MSLAFHFSFATLDLAPFFWTFPAKLLEYSVSPPLYLLSLFPAFVCIYCTPSTANSFSDLFFLSVPTLHLSFEPLGWELGRALSLFFYLPPLRLRIPSSYTACRESRSHHQFCELSNCSLSERDRSDCSRSDC